MLYFCKKKIKIAHLDIEAFCPELFILQLIFPLRTDSYSLKGQSVGFDLFRPPICSCSIAGQCETTEDNILEVSTVNIITLLILWNSNASEIRSRSSRESQRRQNALRSVKTSSAATTTPILERRTLWGELNNLIGIRFYEVGMK